MLSVVIIGLFGVYALIAAHRTQRSLEPMSRNVHNRLQRLWAEAHKNIQNKQWLRAERALLTILRFDKKDASAYNRLGIIYAKQKDYEDAIRCFEIAKSIKPGASNFHNLGLLYLETEDYEKAQVAFEEAIHLDNESAVRYIALAKVFSKTERYKNAVEVLEKAVDIEKTSKNYTLLAEAYQAAGNEEGSSEAQKKAETLKEKEQELRAVNSKSKFSAKDRKSRNKNTVIKRKTPTRSSSAKRLQRRKFID